MIKVLIVDDSSVIQEFLAHVLSSDPEIQVVDIASNGEEAIEAVNRIKPDVITMDIHMPKMDGFEATRIIMETQPTPIVIVTGSTTAREVSTTFRAVEMGALTVVPRPKGIGQPDYEVTAREFIQTVKLMSEVKVIKRWPRLRKKAVSSGQVVKAMRVPAIKAVAIGASTGGPVALHIILSGLPKDFPVPILIVQHMAPGFVEGFIEWLCQSSGYPVHIAADGEYPLPGHAYVAPYGCHMVVRKDHRIALSFDEAKDGLRPSISHLFDSIAKSFGQNAVGVLLTGMGKDGAEELKRMRDSGAVTIAQDKKSSIVFGMPGEAMRLDAATYVLPPERIVSVLVSLVNRK